MRLFRSTTVYSVIFCYVFSTTFALGEAVDDKYSQISPRHVPGAGEFVHGQGYGKLLIRVMIFGAVPAQGVHYMPEGTDLVFGLVYAGGYTDTTQLNGITIRRRGAEETISVNLEDIMEDAKPVPKLQDGDVVSVPFNWRKDMSTFLTLSGFFASITGLVVSVLAFTRSK